MSDNIAIARGILKCKNNAHRKIAFEFIEAMFIELEEEIENLKETHRLQLAGVSVMSLCNTKKSLRKNRIKNTSPYWTAVSDDVAEAMEREIGLIERVKELEAHIEGQVKGPDIKYVY